MSDRKEAGMDLNAGEKPGELGNPARQEVPAMAIKKISGAVKHNRVKSRIEQEHLGGVPRRRVALLHGTDVRPQTVQHSQTTFIICWNETAIDFSKGILCRRSR